MQLEFTEQDSICNKPAAATTRITIDGDALLITQTQSLKRPLPAGL